MMKSLFVAFATARRTLTSKRVGFRCTLLLSYWLIPISFQYCVERRPSWRPALGGMPCHWAFWMMGMKRDFPGANGRSKKTVTFQGEVTIAPQWLRLFNFESHCTMRLMYGSNAQRWKMSLML